MHPNSTQEIPEIQVSLECPSRISLAKDEVVEVKARVTYTGITAPTSTGTGTATPKQDNPITIHLSNMTFAMDYRHGKFVLERWDPAASTWQEVHREETPGGFMLLDDPPLRVRIGDRGDDEFLTLRRPGDSAVATSHTVFRRDSGESLLWYAAAGGDDSINVGDRFRVRYTTTTLDWWNWGAKDGDLEAVEVWLPCWENGVVLDEPGFKEGANGGRPKLKLAEAVPVEFEIVE